MVAVSFLVAALCGRADAGVVINIEQAGGDVVATGSGSLDVTDLSYDGPASTDFGIMNPSIGYLVVGPELVGPVDVYSGISGPSSLGGGGNQLASSGSDGPLGVYGGLLELFVPAGYVSGSSLSAVATWDDATIASLGLTPGTRSYTWGTGTHADSLTISIAAVPEPSSLVMAGFAALAGLGVWARRRANRHPGAGRGLRRRSVMAPRATAQARPARPDAGASGPTIGSCDRSERDRPGSRPRRSGPADAPGRSPAPSIVPASSIPLPWRLTRNIAARLEEEFIWPAR